MPAFLSLDSVSAATPDGRPLFEGLTLTLGAERVGLVGRNGSGKSTLIDIAAGLAEPASGSIARAGRVGRLAQDLPGHVPIDEALGIAQERRRLARVRAGTGSAEDFDAADWSLDGRVEAALGEVGLAGIGFDRPVGTLSGGERARLAIARLGIEAPDLLLLDEPTNNLDEAGRAAVRRLVAGWRGGVLLASHDRDLLEAMDRIVELTPVGIRIVGGGWSAFAAAREAMRERAAAERDRTDAALLQARQAAQRQREAKERRDKRGRAAAAGSSDPKILLDRRAERAENTGGRIRRIGERLVSDAVGEAEAARARVEVLTPLAIDLPPSGLPSGAAVLSVEGAVAELGGRRLGPFSLHVRGPERIALVGPNGSGKTTLLRLSSGRLAPSVGTVLGAAGRIAMLDQHVGELDPEASVVENLRRLNPALDAEGAHAACARFAFRNHDARKPVAALSGGERLRAGLAAVLAGGEPPWLLILDEPTNHLDLEAIEVLERALAGFDGALLVVSHDPAFLGAIGIERWVRLGG